MGTLSSLTGGGSGGGGGDPQGTFQASANVANGDLVVLNDNGTVEPVSSTLNAADFTQSDNGTKLLGSSIRQSSSYGVSMHHNGTRDEYISVAHRDQNEEVTVGSWTYNDSTGQYTNLNYLINGQQYYRVDVHNDNDNDVMLLGFSDGSGDIRVRGAFHDGTNWTVSNSSSPVQGGAGTLNCAYVGRSADGTIALACRSNSMLGVARLSWTNNNTAPQIIDYAYSTNQFSGLNSQQNYIDDGGFYGAYCGGNTHVVAVRDSQNSYEQKLVAFNVTSGGLTYGTVASTGINTSNNYGMIAYDPVGNVGIVGHYNGSTTPIKAFTVNSNLSITVHGTVGSARSVGMVGFNPTSNQFFIQSNNREFTIFSLDNTGNVTNSSTANVYPSLGNTQMEFGSLFPKTNSQYNLLSFQSSGNAGGYINSANHIYTTQFAPEYVETNVDKHFGEAKEAITSGNAGPVAILNRTKDITGSSFQKGGKLFANPSGSALATSGTYRVGYATDTDTILVTGDPS